MNPALRVLHVIPSLSPKRGGPSEAILPMVRALRDRGLEVEIATTNDDGLGVRDMPLGQLVMEGGIPVRYFGRASPPLRALREYAYAGAFRPWLAKQVGEYDLLHVHALFSHLPTSAMSVARAAGVPYLVRPLGLLGRWPLRQSSWRKKLYLKFGEAARLRDAAAVHFTSETERIEAGELGLSLQGIVVPHGIELPALIAQARLRLRAELKLPSNQKVILYLGRLHRKKGLDLLLPSFAQLDDPSVTLVLAGEEDPELTGELAALIRLHRLEHRVVRTGFVTGERKQLLQQGADFFVLSSRHENFGLAVLESLAAGTPVVVSDQVALARQVEEFDLGTVVQLEVESLRLGLSKMLRTCGRNPPDQIRSLVARKFSWESNAAQLHQAYLSALRPTFNKHPWMEASARLGCVPHDESNHRLRSRPRRASW